MESTKQKRNSKEHPPSFTDPPPEYTTETPTPDVTMATGKTKESVKYEDIISKSRLVRSGSPAVYQLRPKKEKIGSLRRMTLGKKDLNKSNRTILLVGETGTGKSALINALVNYTMGVKWEDDVWFQIVEEEEKRKQSESQTSDVIVYQIFGFEGKTLPYSLTIIDTPGYGDTRGIERDDTINERLLDCFYSDDGVHEINAVGLVLTAAVNRLSDRMMYIFDSVVSLFGKNLEQNIVALITHSDGMPPENVLQALKDANIKCAEDEDGDLLHFVFNNCQSREKTKKTKAASKSAWDVTTEGISQFTDFLIKAEPQKLMSTIEVLKKRKVLKACIENLRSRVKHVELKQKAIQETEEALKNHQETTESNKNFTQDVYEPYKEKQDIESERWGFLWLKYKAATSCLICQETCHNPCTKAWNPKDCEMFEKDHCKVCTRKCKVSDHVKEKWIFLTKTKKVTITMNDLKAKYESSKAGEKRESDILKGLEQELYELQKEKDQMLDESFQHVVKLEQIALNVDSLSTLEHLDFLIEKMKEKDKDKIEKLEEMKSRVNERSTAAMRYRRTATVEKTKK